MIERGKVYRIEGDVVYVRCSEDCSSCGKCSFAKREEKDRILPVLNPRNIQLSPGDEVDYYVSPLKAIKAGFLILILPLLLFLLIYFAVEIFWEGASEPVKVLAGFVGIASGFLINLALKHKKKQDLPEILKIISNDR